MTTLSSGQERLLQLAVEQAFNSTMQNRHGCVVARKCKALTVGNNHTRTYLNRQQLVSCHAEIDALYKYMRQSRQCKLSF